MRGQCLPAASKHVQLLLRMRALLARRSSRIGRKSDAVGSERPTALYCVTKTREQVRGERHEGAHGQQFRYTIRTSKSMSTTRKTQGVFSTAWSRARSRGLSKGAIGRILYRRTAARNAAAAVVAAANVVRFPASETPADE